MYALINELWNWCHTYVQEIGQVFKHVLQLRVRVSVAESS